MESLTPASMTAVRCLGRRAVVVASGEGGRRGGGRRQLRRSLALLCPRPALHPSALCPTSAAASHCAPVSARCLSSLPSHPPPAPPPSPAPSPPSTPAPPPPPRSSSPFSITARCWHCGDLLSSASSLYCVACGIPQQTALHTDFFTLLQRSVCTPHLTSPHLTSPPSPHHPPP